MTLKKASSPKIVDSPPDRIQATKRHPEFNRCLNVWRAILRKEQEGLPLTPEEEAMKRTPRSSLNVQAELEATRYQMLSREERERASMTEEDWLWREFNPTINPIPTLGQESVEQVQAWWAQVEKFAIVGVPLHHPLTVIERTVGQIVRTYKGRVGLADAKSSGPPLNGEDCSPQLLNETLTLRIPLRYPVKTIDKAIADIVRHYKKDLMASPQRLRRPEHVDPWAVYDLHTNGKTPLLQITHQLFGTTGTPKYNDEVNKHYAQVCRAYQFARAAIARVGQGSAQ